MSMIVVGGSSGGGFNISKALIHVKAPLDSDVSFSKGSTSKLVPAKKSIPDVDGYNAHYFYQTRSYGEWQINRILGDDVRIESALVEHDYQYDVSMERLYLIQNGVLNAKFTFNQTNLTINPEGTPAGILYIATNGNVAGLYCPNSLIDVAKYKSLKIKLNKGIINAYGQSSFNGSGNVPTIGICSTVPGISGTSVTNVTKSVYMNSSITYIQQDSFTLDISDITNSVGLYVAIAGNTALPGTNGYLNIQDFYLD